MHQQNCGRLCWERVCRALLAAACLRAVTECTSEIYAQEDYISLGEAVPGLAGVLGLIFIDTSIYCDITVSIFLLSEKGENKPNNSTQLNRLFPFSCIKVPCHTCKHEERKWCHQPGIKYSSLRLPSVNDILAYFLSGKKVSLFSLIS